MNLKIEIEALNNYISQEKLDELKAVFENSKLSEYQKNIRKRQISGSCCIDGKIPTKIVKYRRYGATVIEKYCDQCLARINT
jgi:hypothetical protein